MPKYKVKDSTNQYDKSQGLDYKSRENKKEVKNVASIEQEEDKEKELEQGEQNAYKKARAKFVFDEFMDLQKHRNQGFKWFGFGENDKYLQILDYINASEARINCHADKAKWKDEWQANVFDPITREKFNAVLAKLAAQRMKAQFFDSDGLDIKIARVVTNLYDKAGRGKNGQGKDIVLIFMTMFEAASKGTVVRYEGYKEGKRKVKDREKLKQRIKDYDADESEKKDIYKAPMKTIYEWEDLWSEIVPLEEFYPGDVSKTSIQDMTKCAWVQYPSIEDFKQKFSSFKDIDLVQSIGDMTPEEKTEFSVPKDTDDGSVQVIRYYNKTTDAYDCVAGGILLTPLGNALPYEHGGTPQLPFNVGRFEIFSNKFFYGMSLPHKLSSFQDITNSIWNMMLDQLLIAFKTPIFNSTGEELDIDWLFPSNVINLKKGTDINSQVREFNSTPQTATGQSMLATIGSRMSAASASSEVESGQSGGGRKKTAEEVATAHEASLEIASLFLTFMEWAEEDRAEQRCENMLYYYQKPLKETGKLREWVIPDVRLLGSEMGKMKVRITDNPKTERELNAENLATDDMSQVVEISPDQLRNFKKWVKIVPNSSVKDTDAGKLTKELKWYEITNNDQAFNQKENKKGLAEAFGKDINKIINQEDPEEAILDQFQDAGGQPQPANIPGSAPTGKIT